MTRASITLAASCSCRLRPVWTRRRGAKRGVTHPDWAYHGLLVDRDAGGVVLHRLLVGHLLPSDLLLAMQNTRLMASPQDAAIEQLSILAFTRLCQFQ